MQPLPLRQIPAQTAPELAERDRFVPAATILAVAVTLGLIFLGRW